jgi:hypothetical protein
MDTTVNLSLPYIMPAQAQKHDTHNEALTMLDALVQLTVLDRGLAAPPASPAPGARYIVAGGATGDWLGSEEKIALFQDGGWTFMEPKPGWIAWVVDEATLIYWTGSAWENFTSAVTSLQNLSQLGLGTTADAINPFSAKLNKALWAARTVAEGGDGNLRYTLNKEGASKILSLLMQSNWSGRAEIGLTGDDDLHVKMSADGSTWRDALTIAGASGKVSFPSTNMLTDYAVNLYQDSGRFAGNGVNSITVGAFAFPAYLTRYNSTTATGLAKFVTDNADYGGAGAALHAEVRSLIDMIRDPTARRYGVEFWVAQLAHGAGANAPLSYLAQTWYLSLLSTLLPRIPSVTFHVYVKALDAAVVVVRNAGQTMVRNGVVSTDHVTIAPADGWVSLTVRDDSNPRATYGYAPSFLSVYAKTAGDRYLIACPALMGGSTMVDDNAGIVAGYNSWPG